MIFLAVADKVDTILAEAQAVDMILGRGLTIFAAADTVCTILPGAQAVDTILGKGLTQLMLFLAVTDKEAN